MMIMKLTAQRKLEELTGLDIEQAVMILGAIIIMTITMTVAVINTVNLNGGHTNYIVPAI